MQNIEIILSMIVTTVGFLTSTITFFIKFVKSEKEKISAQNTIEIRDVLQGLIAEAEKFSNFTGQEKKGYVMAKIIEYAKNFNLCYDEAQVSNKIDEILALTKVVNVSKSS